MDAGRRHETPMSETKNFIMPLTVTSVSTFCWVGSPSPVPTGWYAGPADTCIHSGLHCRREAPSLRDPNLLSRTVSMSAHILEGDPTSLFEGCLLSTFKRIVHNKGSPCLCAQDAQKCEWSMEYCLPTPASAISYRSIAMWDQAQSSYSLT